MMNTEQIMGNMHGQNLPLLSLLRLCLTAIAYASISWIIQFSFTRKLCSVTGSIVN